MPAKKSPFPAKTTPRDAPPKTTAKTAAKTPAETPAKMPAKKRAAASQPVPPQARAAKVTKTSMPTQAAKAAKAAQPAQPVRAEAKEAKQRVRLVRDSFTMPEPDFALIAALKVRALAAQREAKKSELLRAGLHALMAMDSAALVGALSRLQPLKLGRPKRGH